MKTALPTSYTPAGFSLTEMLMIVSIIGVMAGMVLPWLGGNGEEVRQARDQRNAQNICSLCQAAQAAGMNLAEEASSSLDVARKMAEGVTIEKGIFKGRTFKVPGLADDELEGAARFLSIKEGEVRYQMSEEGAGEISGAQS